MQRVDFQVRVGVFNSQQILQRFLLLCWYCAKNQIEWGLTWHWWNSTDLVLIYMFLINPNAEIVACLLLFRKSRHKPSLESTSKYGFSPDFGGKMAAFWACACKLSWTLFSPARVQPLFFVFTWRHHFPKLQISNPTGVLVSSDIRPFQNFVFYDV